MFSRAEARKVFFAIVMATPLGGCVHIEKSRIEQALRSADLSPRELYQDLNGSLREARFFVRHTQAQTRALALVYEARMLRLRAEFMQARKTLDAASAIAGDELLLRLRIASERELVTTDRLSALAGNLHGVASDLSCSMLPSEGQQLSAPREQSELVRLSNELQKHRVGPERFALRAAARLQRQWALTIHSLLNLNIQADLRAAAALPDEVEPGKVFYQTYASDVEDAIAYDYAPHPGHTQRGLRLRLALLVPGMNLARALPTSVSAADSYAAWLAHVGAMNATSRLPADLKGIAPDPPPEPLLEIISCQEKDLVAPAQGVEPALHALTALSCAEIGLFPGILAEDLGYLAAVPTESPEMLRAWRKLRITEQVRETWRKSHRPRALAWLRLAESEAAALGLPRILLRARLLAIIDDLMSQLGSFRPGAKSSSYDALAAIAARGRSLIVDADRAGARRLGMTAALVEVMATALRGDEAAAQDQLTRFADAAAQEEDHGAALGAARLLATAAVDWLTTRAEPASAQLLLHLSTSLYQRIKGTAEGGNVYLRWAETMAEAGAHEEAVNILRQGWGGLSASCDSKDQALALLHMRASFLSKLVESCLAAQNLACAQQTVPEIMRLLEQVKQCKECTKFDFQMFALEFTELAMKNRWIGIHEAIEAGKSEIVREPDLPQAQRFSALGQRVEALPAPLRPLMLARSWILRGSEERARQALGSHAAVTASLPAMAELRSQVLRSLEKQCLVRPATYLSEFSCQQTRNLWIEQAALLIELGSSEAAHAVLSTVKTIRPAELSDKDRTAQQIPLIELQIATQALLKSRESGASAPALAADADALSLLDKWAQYLNDVEQHRDMIPSESLRFATADSSLSREPFAQAIRSGTRLFSAISGAAERQRAAAQVLEFVERGKALATRELLSQSDPEQVKVLRRQALSRVLLTKLLSETRCVQKQVTPRCMQLFAQRAELDGALQSFSRLRYLIGRKPDHKSALHAELAQSLRPGELLLDYFLVGGGLTVVAVGPRRTADPNEDVPISAIEVPLDRWELRGRVARAQESLELSKLLAPGDVERLGAWLLQAPLASVDLRNVRTLLIIPHQELHRVPWALLPFTPRAGEDPRPLVSDFVIKLVPAAHALAEARIQGQRKQASSQPRLRIVADLGALWHASGELAKVAAAYPLAASREVASWTGLQAALGDDAIVHVTAHGKSTDKAQELREGQEDAEAGYALIRFGAGNVTVFDILRMPGSIRAPTVVMASCRLARGRESTGDEQVGIPRALLARGAGSVIASYWKLHDDEKLVLFMQRLHEHLAQGMDSATALAKTQREAIGDPKTKAAPQEGSLAGSAPHFWAGIVSISVN